MATDNTSSSESVVMLTDATFQQWKNNVVNKSFSFCAHDILTRAEEFPLSGSASEKAFFNQARSKTIGYIRSTLDHAQIENLLAGIPMNDLPAIWEALLETYESKTSGSRATILQELVSLRKGDASHEEEGYADFGSRALALGARLANLLPSPPVYTASSYVRATNTYTASTYTDGYSAAKLTEDLALSMIAIGLIGKDDEMLRHTLNHLDESTMNASEILKHLRKSDVLKQNTANAEASALRASGSTSETPKYKCKIHGAQNSHGSEDCYQLKKRANKKALKAQEANAASSSSTSAPDNDQKAMLAQVAHITQVQPHI